MSGYVGEIHGVPQEALTDAELDEMAALSPTQGPDQTRREP